MGSAIKSPLQIGPACVPQTSAAHRAFCRWQGLTAAVYEEAGAELLLMLGALQPGGAFGNFCALEQVSVV